MPSSEGLKNVLSFRVGHEWKYLQNEMGNKCAKQVFIAPCVEQGHINHIGIKPFSLVSSRHCFWISS